MRKNILLLLILSLLLSSCAKRAFVINENALLKEGANAVSIAIKSGSIRLSEQGFVRLGDGKIDIEVYKLGKSVFNLKMGRKICINDERCVLKKSFNKHFFGKAYYKDLLEDIILSRPIKVEGYYIYEADSEHIYFKNENMFLKLKKVNVK